MKALSAGAAGGQGAEAPNAAKMQALAQGKGICFVLLFSKMDRQQIYQFFLHLVRFLVCRFRLALNDFLFVGLWDFDTKHAVYFKQAFNGVPVRMAILEALIGK